METKTFGRVSSICLVLTLSAAILSVIGIYITGVYPGIFVLLLLATIPIASKLYIKRKHGQSATIPRRYFSILTVIHLLLVLLVLWMSFVILVDRVFGSLL